MLYLNKFKVYIYIKNNLYYQILTTFQCYVWNIEIHVEKNMTSMNFNELSNFL